MADLPLVGLNELQESLKEWVTSNQGQGKAVSMWSGAGNFIGG